MSLNNLTLTPGLIEQLYKNSLYDDTPPVIESSTLTSKNTDFKHLGKNQKNILIAVSYADVSTITDDDLNFLTQLLKACQLTLADVAIFNFNNYSGEDFNTIINFFNTANVLLFGISTADFGFSFNIPLYKLQQHNNINVMSSNALFQIKEDKAQKQQLWLGLKQMFNI